MEDEKEVVLERMNRQATKKVELEIANSYKMAISLIANKDLPWKDICVEFAKEYPDLFVKIANNFPNLLADNRFCFRSGGHEILVTNRELESIDLLIRENRKIYAIKAARDCSDLGLKEAKEWVEGRMESLKSKYYKEEGEL